MQKNYTSIAMQQLSYITGTTYIKNIFEYYSKTLKHFCYILCVLYIPQAGLYFLMVLQRPLPGATRAGVAMPASVKDIGNPKYA